MSTSAIPRLDLSPYQWWNEALHSVLGSPGVHFGDDLPAVTSFIMIINLSATFNKTLVYRMCDVMPMHMSLVYKVIMMNVILIIHENLMDWQ